MDKILGLDSLVDRIVGSVVDPVAVPVVPRLVVLLLLLLPSARPPEYPRQAVPVTRQYDPGEINTSLKVAMRVTIINYRISLIIFLGMLVAAVIRIISLVVLSSWQNFRIFKRSTPLLAHKPSVALLTLPSL